MLKLTMMAALLLMLAPTAYAVDYEWQDASGTVRSLADYKGKPVILHFWASWCHPCRNEMPELAAWSKAHADVTLLVVSVDRNYADADAFLKSENITFPTLMGDMTAAMRLGARGLPTTLVIGSDSEIVKTRVGSINWSGEEGDSILKAVAPAVDAASSSL